MLAPFGIHCQTATNAIIDPHTLLHRQSRPREEATGPLPKSVHRHYRYDSHPNSPSGPDRLLTLLCRCHHLHHQLKYSESDREHGGRSPDQPRPINTWHSSPASNCAGDRRPLHDTRQPLRARLWTESRNTITLLSLRHDTMDGSVRRGGCHRSCRWKGNVDDGGRASDWREECE